MIKIRKKGFTLIEVIVSLFIISIVIIGSVGFYNMGRKLLNTTYSQGIINSNLRIAQEFVAEKVENSATLILNGNNILIDGNRLFVDKMILRYGTGSQQIATDIVDVFIENLGDDICRVTIKGEYEVLSTIVKRGEG